jgi:hypothetical protein
MFSELNNFPWFTQLVSSKFLISESVSGQCRTVQETFKLPFAEPSSVFKFKFV